MGGHDIHTVAALALILLQPCKQTLDSSSCILASCYMIQLCFSVKQLKIGASIWILQPLTYVKIRKYGVKLSNVCYMIVHTLMNVRAHNVPVYISQHLIRTCRLTVDLGIKNGLMLYTPTVSV